MDPIKSREEALKLIERVNSGEIPTFSDLWGDVIDALYEFCLTAEQKEAMKDAEYKYAVHIGIDPAYAEFLFSTQRETEE